LQRGDGAALSVAEEKFGSAQATWKNEMSDTAKAGEILGRLRAIVALASYGLEQIQSPAAAAAVEPGSVGSRFLNALRDADSELSSSDLAAVLRVDATEVSRTGRRLLGLNMVSRKRLGRRSRWTLTPHGHTVSTSMHKQEREVAALPMPRPVLLVWGEAQQRKVQRRPSPFSASQRLLPIDLIAAMLEDRRARAELSATLRMSRSVCRFVADREMSFQIVHGPDGKSTAENCWKALSNSFGRSFDFGSFWPSAAPIWHAHAIVENELGDRGVLLIDVPENPKQVAAQESRIKREDHIRAAKAALREATREFGLPRRVIPREPHYSDLLRRLVLVHYLRSHCAIPAWSARICLVMSHPTSQFPDMPSSKDEWELAEHSRLAVDDESLAEWTERHFVPIESPSK
jgi:DNA-binding MarR family transcriptional regulator